MPLKNQQTIKKIMCIILLAIMLFGLFPVEAFAASFNSVYIETLIDSDNMIYSSDLVSDTANSNSKYDYKYANLSSYINNACSTKNDMATNPNACYTLDGSISESSKWMSSGSSTIDFFAATEGINISNAPSMYLTSDGSDSKSKLFSNSANYPPVLEFPGIKKSTRDVNTQEREYAKEISNTLVSSLNSILSRVNYGSKYDSVEKLVNKSILIRPSNNDNVAYIPGTDSQPGYVLVYAKNNGGKTYASSSDIGKIADGKTFSSADSFFSATGFPSKMQNGGLLVYLIRANANGTCSSGNFKVGGDDACSVSSTVSYYVYAMPKGYVATEDGGDIKFGTVDNQGNVKSIEEDDVPFITIHMLAQSANSRYKAYGHTISTVDNTEETDILSGMIIKVITGIIDGISSVLGLTDVNELIYNGGARGSSDFNYGVMSDNWWNVVMRYHLIFQALAWFVMIVGFLKTIITLNTSTINPGTREAVYNTIMRFITTGFMLVLIIPATQFMMSLNGSVVGIFASQVNESLNWSPAVKGWGGIVLSLCYLSIRIYMNFVYIMRSITIALLVVSAPFFIATVAFSKGAQQKMFMPWLKELVSNIFIQSVHAFTMAFLVNLIQSGSRLESVVIAFSIIPITEMFRGLILAGGAGTTEGLGKGAAAKYTAATTAAVSAAGNAVLGAGAAAIGAGTGLDMMGEGSAGGAGAGVGAGAAGGDAMGPGIDRRVSMGGGVDAVSTLGRTAENRVQTAAKSAEAKGNDVKASGLKALGATMTAARGASRFVGGVGQMATNIAMADFTGNYSSGYGNAGAVAGGMAGQAIREGGYAAMTANQRSHDSSINDANVQGADLNQINNEYLGNQGMMSGDGSTLTCNSADFNGNAHMPQDFKDTVNNAIAGDSKAQQKLINNYGVSARASGTSGISFSSVGTSSVQRQTVSKTDNSLFSQHAISGMKWDNSIGANGKPSGMVEGSIPMDTFTKNYASSPISKMQSGQEASLAGGGTVKREGDTLKFYNIEGQAMSNGNGVITRTKHGEATPNLLNITGEFRPIGEPISMGGNQTAN